MTNAMERLAEEMGVDIQCGQLVTQITPDGVHVQPTNQSVASTEFLPADLVIVNADLPYATQSLLQPKTIVENTSPPEPIFDWDDQFTFSSGVISFHWSLNKTLDDLNTHNVFLMASSRSQAEATWETMRTNQGDVTPQSAFNFYVHRASRTDPTAAPQGCDTLMILVPCRTLLRDEECAKLPREEALRRYQSQFTPKVVAQARQAVLQRLSVLDSMEGLDKHIVDEVVDTPATWAEQFHLAAGTPFALVGAVVARLVCRCSCCCKLLSRLFIFTFAHRATGFSN